MTSFGNNHSRRKIAPVLVSCILVELARKCVFVELPRRVTEVKQCPVLISPDPPRPSPNGSVRSLQYGPEARVVGGYYSDDNLASYFAYVFNPNSNTFCTGILITPTDVLLTTACNVTVNKSFASIGARKNLASAPNFTISAFTTHDSSDSVHFAYATLNESLADNKSIDAKYALISNDSSAPLERSVVRIVGYGYIQYDFRGKEDAPDGSLQQVDVPVVSWEYCSNIFYNIEISREREFCTGFFEGGCSAW